MRLRVMVIQKEWAILVGILTVLFVFFALRALSSSPMISRVLGTSRKIPIYSVQKEAKEVALSFDAAWGASRTPEILDIMEQYELTTTFFLVSFWIEDYPEMARQIAARGHEIGLHSSTHPHMTSLSPGAIRKELRENRRLIEEVTGQRANLFRPPFGEYDDRLIEVAESMNLVTIQWSLDSLDWKDLSAERMAKRILDNIEPGDIVLFHNNGKNTPAALRKIIPALLERGYEIKPISDLILKENYYIDHEGRQRPRPGAKEE